MLLYVIQIREALCELWRFQQGQLQERAAVCAITELEAKLMEVVHA
jgi:hypothetical protein